MIIIIRNNNNTIWLIDFYQPCPAGASASHPILQILKN